MAQVRTLRPIVLALVSCSLLAPRLAHSQWLSNGNALCTEIHNQRTSGSCTDGQGGAFVAWYDSRNGDSPGSVYLQHILATGQVDPSWPVDGKLIASTVSGTPNYENELVELVDDSAGGAIVVWQTSGGMNYALRVTASGLPAAGWPSAGIATITLGHDYTAATPAIAVTSDGSGGVFVATSSNRGSPNGLDIIAQHVTGSGTVATGWGVSGVVVSTGTDQQYQPAIARDAAGGLFVAWMEGDANGNSQADIKAARVNSTGGVMWTTTVSAAPSAQLDPQIMADRSGGVYVCWDDENPPGNPRAVRLTSSGSLAGGWPQGGIIICPLESVGLIAVGSAGELYVAWSDFQTDIQGDARASRITTDGQYSPGWGGSAGVPVAALAQSQFVQSIAADSSDGVIITWLDRRNGSSPGPFDIYAQRLKSDASVSAGWMPNGTPVCTATGDQNRVRVVGDFRNGAIISWTDNRAGSSNSDIYAERINSIGTSAPANEWMTNGVPFRVGYSQLLVTSLFTLADGTGGTYFAWTDAATGVNAPHVQRLDSTGYPHAGWPSNGALIGAGVATCIVRDACSDGAGGVFLVCDRGSAPSFATVLFRIDASGHAASGWPADGLVVIAGPTQFLPTGLIPDGGGGVYVSWLNLGGGGIGDVYVQRVAASGTLQWSSSGVRVSTNGDVTSNNLVSAGPGAGCIAVWARFSGYLRAQSVSEIGLPRWGTGGIEVANSVSLLTEYTSMLPTRSTDDGSGGVIIAYQSSAAPHRLYSQHLTAFGAYANGYAYGGLPVTSLSTFQGSESILSDGAGGAFLAWNDRRGGSSDDIYVQRILPSGLPATGWPANGLGVSVGGGVWHQLSPWKPLAADGTGGLLVDWSNDHSGGPDGYTDVYCSRVLSGGTIDVAIPTNGLLLSGAVGAQMYSVALVSSPGVGIFAWFDDPDAPIGYNRNLLAQKFAFDVVPPAAVSNLSAQVGYSSIAVKWTAPGDDGTAGTAAAYDLRYSTSPINTTNFSAATAISTGTPAPAGTQECALLDGLPHCHTYYFALETRDESFNWSALSNVLAAGACGHGIEVDCGGGAAARRMGVGLSGALALYPPWPNPSATSASIEFELPAGSVAATMELGIFDLAGREVRRVLAGPAKAGARTVSWDLRNSGGERVRGGIYFMRLRYDQSKLERMIVVL